MATNDFQPIATSGGANVDTQASYVASAIRPIGFGLNAVPPSSLWNKMMRQASVITSQFAQMISDYSGQDMLDDGNLGTLLSRMKTQFRIRLIANTNFYVATTGNNANDGLTLATPWATLQYATDTIQKLYDLNGFTATINVAAGTYLSGTIINGPFVGSKGRASLVISGAGPTTIVSEADPFSGNDGTAFTVQNMTVRGSDRGVTAAVGALIAVKSLVFDSPAGSFHMDAHANGQLYIQGPVTIAANAQAWAASANGGLISCNAQTITMSGTPVWSNAGIYTQGGNAEMLGVTFVGPASGARYSTTYGGNIATNGAGATYLPGSTAGISLGQGNNYF